MLNHTGSTGPLACWRLWLSEFELDVFHQAADALSRLCALGEGTKRVEDDLGLLVIDTKDENSNRICVMNTNINGIVSLDRWPDAPINKFLTQNEFVVEQVLETTAKQPHSELVDQTWSSVSMTLDFFYASSSLITPSKLFSGIPSQLETIHFTLHFYSRTPRSV